MAFIASEQGEAPLFRQMARPAVQGAYVPGEILVQFTSGGGAEARSAALADIGGRVAEVVRGHRPEHAGEGVAARVTLGPGVSVEQAIAVIAKRPGVSFAEPNFLYTIDASINDPAYTSGQLWGMYGDRTSPLNQYGSQAGEAWSAGYTGSTKVAVGVVDTGIDYTHPDLYRNVWLNPGEIPQNLRGSLVDTDGDVLIGFRDLNDAKNAGLVSDLNRNGRIDAGDLLSDSRWENSADDDLNGYVDDLIGWDFVNNDNDPYDDNDHGTHVSGTIAGMGGNGAGVAGVAWSAQVVALKFLSATGSGSLDNALAAVDYFTAASRASTLVDFAATNNSWGGGGYSQSLLDSIVRGAKSDILFVAAAGNGGSDGRGDNNDSTASYPANYDTTAGAGYDAVIAVAAITSSGALSAFSNYGATSVDLGAPGSSIYSTLPGGGYGSFSGTSMAAPHVSGAIALYAAVSGTAAPARDLRANLLDTAAYTSALDGKTVSDGRLDAMSLLQRAGTSPAGSTIYGTTGSDAIVGTSLADKIWGVPADGTHLGRGTIDRLTGKEGSDVFVLGDGRGRFYDDGRSKSAGTSDYALVMDFGSGDKIQLAEPFARYIQQATQLNGVSGMGIYYDSNASGRYDSRDELVGLLAGVQTPLVDAQIMVA